MLTPPCNQMGTKTGERLLGPARGGGRGGAGHPEHHVALRPRAFPRYVSCPDSPVRGACARGGAALDRCGAQPTTPSPALPPRPRLQRGGGHAGVVAGPAHGHDLPGRPVVAGDAQGECACCSWSCYRSPYLLSSLVTRVQSIFLLVYHIPARHSRRLNTHQTTRTRHANKHRPYDLTSSPPPPPPLPTTPALAGAAAWAGELANLLAVDAQSVLELMVFSE